MREPGRSVVWMQRFAGGFMLALLGPLTAVADSDDGRLVVQGTGVVQAVPDMASFRVGVTTRAASAAGALRENSENAAAIVERLQELGVAAEDLMTANISLFPEFERVGGQQDGPPRIRGYRASNNFSVTVRKLGTLGPLLDALVEAGATDIGTIVFQSTEIERLKDDALVLAMRRAREKAERLSAAAGVGLEEIILIAEQFGGGPAPVFSARTFAESAVPIAPGQQRIEAVVTVAFGLEE